MSIWTALFLAEASPLKLQLFLEKYPHHIFYQWWILDICIYKNLKLNYGKVEVAIRNDLQLHNDCIH